MRVRYRVGVVGESQRVVHYAVEELPGALLRMLCGVRMRLDQAERIDVGGMPCMQCTARAALASKRARPQVEQ
ncbi:hypothetical protein GCM10027563_19220 [Parasphingorhabdus pacifica]